MNITHKLQAVALLAALAGAAHANPLVYAPVNPTFGGNPLNGSYLLNRAQTQDRWKDPDAASPFNPQSSQSQLEQFNSALQQAVLSRISAAVSSTIVGPDGKLIPGTVETQNFLITISDLGGNRIRIVTTDKLSGSTTSFDITQ
jgi:curli production assembly/transport component CsgF